jgi:hypothetical protein
MPKSKTPLRCLLLSGALLTLAACDEEVIGPDTVTFDGVTYIAVGRATLDEAAGGLVVGRGDSAAEYGVRVDLDDALGGDLAAADFRVEPVDLPAAGRWGLQLFGDVDGVSERVALATVWNDAVDDTTSAIVFDFAPSIGATTATVEYYLDGQLLYRVPGLPLEGDGARLRAVEVGLTGGLAQSVHVIRDGTRYIVATDYGGEPRTTPGGCAGALVRVRFPGFPDIPPEFCTDYVQAIPDAFEDVEDVTELEIRARVLEAFTLTRGDVE